MNLLNDVSRCHGKDEPICNNCARRLQIHRDATIPTKAVRWFSYIAPVPKWDYCEQHIKEQSNAHI